MTRTRKAPDDRELLALAWMEEQRKHGQGPVGATEPAPERPQEAAADSPPPAPDARPPVARKRLNAGERRFVKAYLGEAAGNATRAAEMAGYTPRLGPSILRRPHVAAVVQEAIAAEAAERRVTKSSLVSAALRVLEADRPFERLKAIETLAKLLGLLAPTRSIREQITHQQVGGGYQQILQTLQEHADDLTPEQRAAMRARVAEDLEAARKVLLLLGTEGTSAH
jgi:hypothetical protein